MRLLRRSDPALRTPTHAGTTCTRKRSQVTVNDQDPYSVSHTDSGPRRDRRVAGVPRRARRREGPPARPRDHAEPAQALEGTAPRRADGSDDRLHQHDRARERARVPRRRRARAPLPRVDPLERRGHRAPGAAPRIAVGGHISTYASSAALYEVGLNRFFRGQDHPGGGDQIFYQGHASPGMYARAFLEGRLSDRPARRVPPGEVARAERPVVVPAPAAHARVLAVPDGLDGPRPDQRDLPGAGATAT